MKSYLVLLMTLVFALGNGFSRTHEFVHPGMPWTTKDLDQMKKNRDVSPWSEGWDIIAKSRMASLDYEMEGPAVNVDRHDNNIANDADAALYHALQWYFTKDAKHADKAIGILGAWATTHKTWSGTSVHLHAAWRGGTFVKAAEILRHTYPGWKESYSEKCEEYFTEVIWPQFRIPNPLRGANQGANNIWGAIQIAVFCSDHKKFTQCLDAFLYDPSGGISNTLPDGQNGDSGRDQGHSMAMIANLVSTAEIAWAQGIDLYEVLDNRLLAVHDYWCRYNSGKDVPFVDYGTSYGYYIAVGPHGRNPASVSSIALNEMVYGAYVVRKGLAAPNVKAYRDGVPTGAETFLYRKDSGYDSEAPIKVKLLPKFVMADVAKLDSSDIGTAGASGSSSYENGTWTVKSSGSGFDDGKNGDSFHFAYTEMSGDGAFVARVDSVGDTDDSAIAAIVIRESLAADSKMAAVGGTPNGGTKFSSRGFDAADGSGQQHFPLAQTPIWIKIERRRGSVAGYVGPDGIHWTPMQNIRLSLPGKYYIGLGVASHDGSSVNTSTFTNVQKSVGFDK